MSAAGMIEFARIWLMIGGVVAVAFLFIGIDRIDEDAQEAYVFRPLLIPGVLLIWPLVLWRWLRLETNSDVWAKRYRPPRAVHLPVALVMSAAMAFAVISGLAVRQEWPADIAPQQLSVATE